MKKIIGARGSKLSLWQANWVRERLAEKIPGLELELEIVRTEGDERHDLAPEAFGREGIFTAELDRALLDRRIDLAVHSLKDLPTRLATGLALAAITERGPISDLLIVRTEHAGAEDLLEQDDLDLTIGTSSLRRIAQLKHRFPGLKFAPLRGNLDTRLRKLGEGKYQAIVAARAGIERLAIEVAPHLALELPFEMMLPAAGQGALAVETRADDPAFEIARAIDHAATRAATIAEREAMSALGAGCRVPAGFLGVAHNGKLTVRGVVAGLGGKPLIRAEAEGEMARPERAGARLAQKLLDQGAAAVLAEARA